MATFALLAGGAHNAWCWERVVPELLHRGHRAIAVTLPTSDASLGLVGFADSVVAALSGEHEDLVIVGHSLAGRYLPLVAGRLPDPRLIFLCAIVPQDNEQDETVNGLNSDAASERQRIYDEQGRTVVPSFEEARDRFYGDCDMATVIWATSQLCPTSGRVKREPFPRGGWPTGVASAYILCTEDRTIVPERARVFATKRLGVTPVEIPGSHSPFLSRPALLADTLVDLLGDNKHWGIRRQ